MATSVPVPMAIPTAVADHGDYLAFLLKLFHFPGFALRQNVSQNSVNPGLLGNGISSLLIIAGDHNNLESQVV
jgi:hypothetical protein